jgi:hypothetical protein
LAGHVGVRQCICFVPDTRLSNTRSPRRGRQRSPRLGQRLEAALAALAACPRTANSDRQIRDGLVKQAGYALWLFVVQREACGLNKIDHVIQVYGVPNEVVARMGPLTMPSMHRTKAMAVEDARAPMF